MNNCVFLFLFKNPKVKSNAFNSDLVTRENFMFFGILTLLISAIFTFFGTSAPLITGILMEKASNVYVIESDFGWSDLGTWGSLHEIRAKDKNRNAVSGKNVMIFDSHNNIVDMPEDKLVVIQGLDDYIVVEDENVLLICKKGDEQQIKQIVADVKIEKGERFV